jgi:putative ABC transport system permease protein
MGYALATVWHERNRYLPGVVAVTFSALIVFVPTGVLLGLFNQTSASVDHAPAQLWVGHPNTRCLDLPRSIPARWLARLYEHPAIERAETCVLALALVDDVRRERSESVTVVGVRLGQESLGLPGGSRLAPGVREALATPGAVAADPEDKLALGPGDSVEVLGRRVCLAGPVHLRSLAAPYLFCSEDTARSLVQGLAPGRVMYLLARCKPGADPARVAEELNARYPDMRAYTKEDFAAKTRQHWFATAQVAKATLATALLGMVVGVGVTGLILYSATAAAQREYAVLQALGVPSWRMAAAVLAQSGWVGGLGIAAALPLAFALRAVAAGRGVLMDFPPWLLAGGSALTVCVALLSGLFALRALGLSEPARLLR